MLKLFSAATIAPWITESFPIIRLVLIIIMALVSALLVICVLLQPSGESGGMGALTGQTNETFYAKNKSKSIQGFFKKLTIVFGVCLVVLSLLFFVTVVIYPVQ